MQAISVHAVVKASIVYFHVLECFSFVIIAVTVGKVIYINILALPIPSVDSLACVRFGIYARKNSKALKYTQISARPQ